MKTFIFYIFVLYCFVLWPRTVKSHNEKNILKRISRNYSQIVTDLNLFNSNISTKPNENVGSTNSMASSTSFITNIPTETSSTSGMTTLGDNKSINEVDTFLNTLPDQNYGNFVIVIFFSAMLILILGLLFTVIYKKRGNSFYQVRRRHNHQETPA